MTCPTCRRPDMDDSCGPKNNRPCECCGMVLIASVENDESSDEDSRQQESSDE